MSEMTEREMARAARATMNLPDYGPARPMQAADAWRPISGFCDRYEVSNMGLVRRAEDGVFVSIQTNYLGYKCCSLSTSMLPYKAKPARVHRLVAKAFIDNPLGKPNINHIDCDPSNNVWTNLEWCTQKENLAYARKLGRLKFIYFKGMRSTYASLSDQTAEAIRKHRNSTSDSLAKIAEIFGTSKRTVLRIVKGESYLPPLERNSPVNYPPAMNMSTAPRDGTRILVLAEVASDEYGSAFNGPVVAMWDPGDARYSGWCLSPDAPGSRIDGEPTGWFPLPTEQR